MEHSQIVQRSNGQRTVTGLALVLVLGAGLYVSTSRGFSSAGTALFAITALLLLYLCWKPDQKASSSVGVIAVGAIVYAIPPELVISSPSFGAGLMIIGGAVTALRIF